MKHLKANPNQLRRAKPLIDFDVPLRRKFPISQPSILARFDGYNRSRAYDHRIKPFGFVQSIVPAIVGSKEPLPIAPFEADLAKSKRLPWIDYNTGEILRLDWNSSGMESTIPVTPLSEYIDQYEKHPEAKAADWKGDPAGADTIGLLGRLKLRSKRLSRIGKDVDRLKEDEGASLTPDQPIEYECDDLATDIDYLAQFPQELVAADLALTVRGWRNLIKRISQPRNRTAELITGVAAEHRARSGG